MQHGEGVKRVTRADNKILLAIQLVGHGPVAYIRWEMRMPENVPGRRIVGDEVSSRIAGEEELPGCGEDARTAARACTVLVAPFDLAGFIIDGFQRDFRPHA